MGRIGFFLAGVGIAALAAPAFAQDAPPQTPPEGPGLQDIVVTAQRRSERLQDVPVAITAAGAQQLATARVENIANVAAISPSVQFTAGNISTSTANIQIRGLGTTGNSRSFEGAVGVFIDGVYRTRAAAALQNFNDIDNLQILRGPQGTLFGKNTSAGAVLISSTAPELDRVEGKYEIGYGNFDTFLAKGAVNVPLSENAAIRVAGLYSTRDGIYKDVNTGKRLNGDETYAFKGQFLFEPVDTVKIRLIGDYSRGHGACCYATSNLVDGPTQPLVDALTLALGLKTPSTRLKDYEVALNHPGNQVVKDYGGTLLTDIELGGDTLKSVTALRKFSVIQTDVDPDFSGADIFSLDEDFASRFFSQELTYNGKISSLNANYVLGAFYSNEKLSMARATRWGSQGQVYWDTLLSAAGLPPGTVYAAPGTWATEAMGGRSRSYAAFAHFDFKVGDKWNIIAGLRYSIEKKSGFFFNPFYRSEPNDVFRVLGVQPGPAYNASRTDKALSGTFGIQYHPSRDAMIYLTYNRGFKAGGVNMDANAAGLPANNPAEVPGATPLDPTYRPEKVDAVELGAKIEYLDRRARTNVAVFYNHVSDLQVAQFIGLQFAVLNAKSAETYGLEIENLFKINDAVTLGLDGTWLPKAAFGDDPNIDPVLSGHRFRYASKFTGNATVNLDQPITDDLSLTGRVQYQYTGPQLYNTASLVRRSAVSLVNANLGIKSGRGGWQVEAWVQNLFDKIYGTFAFNTPLQTGDENVYLAAPRTFGLTLRGNFQGKEAERSGDRSASCLDGPGRSAIMSNGYSSRSMESRVVLVSGASSGLGAHFARVLAAAGASVVLVARRTDKLETIVAEIQASGGRAVGVRMDVTDPVSVGQAYEEGERAFGPIDGVIANAGMNSEGLALELGADEFDAVMATNVKGVFLTVQEAARRMIAQSSRERENGRILIISSITAHAVTPGLAAYSASKAAVVQLGRVLAREWARTGISVNILCPGYIETDLNDEWFASEGGQKQIARWPRKRLLAAEDLDATVLHLLSDAARRVTGGVFTIDDGQSL